MAVQRRSLNYLYYPYFKQYNAVNLRNCLNRSLEVRHLMSSLSFFMDNHQPGNLRSKLMYFKSVHNALRLLVGSPSHGSAVYFKSVDTVTVFFNDLKIFFVYFCTFCLLKNFLKFMKSIKKANLSL